MRKHLPLLLFALILSACNLAGDITPPPGVPTVRAVRPTVEATEVPTSTEAPILFTPPKVQANLQNGEMIYLDKCSPCHGSRGLGDGPQATNLPEGISPSPLGESSVSFSAVPQEWYSIVTAGNIERFMPGFSSLSETERWDVIAYALSLSFTSEALATGERIYTQYCVECHAEGGTGTEIGTTLADPSFIANQSVERLMDVTRDGTEGDMPGFGDELSDDELRAVSIYLMDLGLSGGASDSVEEIVESLEEPEWSLVLGQAINGTSGGDLPDGVRVTLYAFNGQQEVIREEVGLDDAGAFRFGEVELMPGWILVATLEHQGVLYGSEIVEYSGEEEVFLPLTYFETSVDLAGVFVDRLHAIFNVPSEGVLEITQLFIISNIDDHTLATPDGVGVLEIPLPEGATNLRFDNGNLGDRYVSSTRGFIDTLPLRPGLGSHEVVFSFELPYDGTLDYTQEMDYPVDAIVLLTPPVGPELEGEGITDQGALEMGGTLLRNYSANPIEPGEVFDVKVRGTGEQGDVDNASIDNLFIGIGALILALGSIGFWWLRKREPADEESGKVVDEFRRDQPIESQDREALLRSIARLDDAFEAGELDETAYRARRSQLKSTLLNLMQVQDHD